MLAGLMPACGQAQAADPHFVGILSIAAEEAGAQQLGLSREVREKLRELIERREKAAVPLALEIKDLPPRERERRLAPFVAETERLGMELLTLEQRGKLNQLRLRRHGMSTLKRPDMARMLELTEDQKREVQRLIDERDAEMTRGGESTQRRTRDAYERRLRATLTEKQRAMWEQMAGLGPGPAAKERNKPPVLAVGPETTEPETGDKAPEVSDGVSAGEPSEGQASERDEETEQVEHQADSEPEKEVPDQAVDEPVETVQTADGADSGSGDEPRGVAEPNGAESAAETPENETTAKRQVGEDAPPVTEANPSSSGPEESAGGWESASDASIEDSEESARQTGDGPAVQSPSDVAPPPEVKSEAMEDAEPTEGAAPDVTAADRENMKLRFNFRYQPWEDVLDWLAEQADLSLQSNIIPEGTFNYTDTRTYTPTEAIDVINGVLLQQGYTLVRRGRMLSVMDLEQEIPEVLVEFVPVGELEERGRFELVKTVFHLARMNPEAVEQEIGQLLGPGREMVVMPQARQVLVTGTAGKLRTIRDVIEQAENPSDVDGALTEITLEHVTPEEVLGPARALLGLEEGANVGEGISIAQDITGTRLFVHGERENIELLTDLVDRMDRERETSPASVAVEQPQLRTHPIRTANPEEALSVLQTLLAGLPDVRMSLDPDTNKIIALARPSEHKTIEETIKQLEGEAPRLEVIQLDRIDPQMAVVAIDNFFSSESEEEPSTIKIDADPTTMRLYVRATPAEIEQIKDLIQQLESPAEGSAGGTLRFIPLGNSATAESTVETARRMWMGPNKIELITPSESEPSMFDLKEVNPEPADAPSFQPPIPRSTPNTKPSRRLNPTRQPSSNTADQDKVTFQRHYRRVNGVPVQLASLNRPAEPGPNGRSEPTGLNKLDEQRQHEPEIPSASTRGENAMRSDTERETSAGQDAAENGEQSEPDEKRAGSEAASKPPANVDSNEADSSKGAEIRIQLTPEGILIASEDTDALDRFESLLRQVTGPQKITASRDFTVYFLKYCKAEVARQLISDILGGSTSGVSAGSLAGDVASSLVGGGGGILGTLLGGGGGEEGNAVTTIQASGPVSIVADARLNCLVVQAMPADLELIEQLLKVIDREGSITDVRTAGKPHIIPIIYLNAQDVASVVQEAYADRIAQSGGNNQRGGRPDPAELIRALRGGRGGGGGNGGNNVVSESPKMSVAVDAASNSLIVTAPEPLFKEVEELVYQIDQASSELTEDVVVVSLKSANPEAVQQALASVMGESASRSSSQGGSSNRSSSNARSSSGGRSPADMRARAEAFRRMREAFGRGGRRGGGGDRGSSRGGAPQRGRGGGRGR